MVLHDRERIAQRLVGEDRDRIGDHARFELLDQADLGGLLLDVDVELLDLGDARHVEGQGGGPRHADPFEPRLLKAKTGAEQFGGCVRTGHLRDHRVGRGGDALDQGDRLGEPGLGGAVVGVQLGEGQRLILRAREAVGLGDDLRDAALAFFIGDLREVERNVDRLKMERERLGAVNLRAEEEQKELSDKLAALIKERDDIIDAIRKLRGAIQSVPRGQTEGANSLGLPTSVTFWKIILPQALIVALRPYGNEIILMIKGSAVVAVVTVLDLMGQTRYAFSRTFDYQTYLWAAIFYLVIVELLRNTWAALEARLTRHLKR